MVYFIILAQLANLGVVFSVDFYFLGKKNTFVPGLFRFMSQFLFLGLIWFFFTNWNSLTLIFLLLTIVRLIEGLSFYGLYKWISKSTSLPKVKFKKSIKMLKTNFYLGLGSKMSFINLSIPLILIPFFYSQDTLGVYSVAHKLFLMVITVFSVFNIILSPNIVEQLKLSKYELKKNLHKNILIVLIVSVILGSGFYLTRTQIIQLLFESSYYDSTHLIPYFVVLVPVWGIYSVITAYINNLGLDRSYGKTSVLHLLISMVLILISLKFFDFKYVIIALAFSTSVITISLYLSISKYLNLNHE